MAIHVSYDREQAVKGTADVLAAIERLRSGKTTDDEVLAAREPLLARWRESMATVDGAALEYTRSIALGIGTSFAVDYPARLAKVRREDVIRVAHEYLAAKSLHVVLMGEDRWLDVAPLGMGSVVNLPLR
jgi:predicted Zn-dependent peptidase